MAIAIPPRVRDDFELDAATGVSRPRRRERTTSYRDGAEQYLFDGRRHAGDRWWAWRPSPRSSATGRRCTTSARTARRCSTASASAPGGPRALELGAGCGVISRWLGEHGAEVHAIEGGLARAEVARAARRTSTTSQVYAGNYSDLGEAGCSTWSR